MKGEAPRMNDKSEAGTKPHSFAGPVACNSLGVFLGGHQLLSFFHRLISHSLRSHLFLDKSPDSSWVLGNFRREGDLNLNRMVRTLPCLSPADGQVFFWLGCTLKPCQGRRPVTRTDLDPAGSNLQPAALRLKPLRLYLLNCHTVA